jgi:hypothetical protein
VSASFHFMTTREGSSRRLVGGLHHDYQVDSPASLAGDRYRHRERVVNERELSQLAREAGLVGERVNEAVVGYAIRDQPSAVDFVSSAMALADAFRISATSSR